MKIEGIAIALAGVVAGGCGAAANGPGTLRFHNQPPVWRVDDRRPIAEPEEKETGLVGYYLRQDLAQPMLRALTPDADRRAADVNSLGEVPDSTWFQGRIGRGAVTPDDVRRGPGDGDGPDRSGPWQITGIKQGGAAIGFTMRDARGVDYIIKFDEKGHEELNSSTDVVVQRLVWAFGYNVPENDVVEFHRDQLVLAPDAVFANQSGDERPMTEADLENFISLVASDDGNYRALASRFIEGKPIGGIAPQGVRPDDPNDTIPHELRRSLRGQRLLFAWVNHTDVKADNSLDSYVDGGYVRHYFLDFGVSLGAWARTDPSRLYMGHRGYTGVADGLRSLFSLGIWVPPWERKVDYPSYRGLGFFGAEHFDPERWTPHHAWLPIDLADRFDDYWAAKILLAFTPEHVRAAVDAARYSDPRTADYLTEVLVRRKHELVRHALSRVAPLEHFEVAELRGGLEICFEDLWISRGFAGDRRTTYEAEAYDYDGEPTGSAEASADPSGRSCVGPVAPGRSHGRYTMVEIEPERDDVDMPEIYVHVAPDDGGGWRVIGLDRR